MQKIKRFGIIKKCLLIASFFSNRKNIIQKAPVIVKWKVVKIFSVFIIDMIHENNEGVKIGYSE